MTDRINADQMHTVWPKAEGVEEAMKASVSMDADSLRKLSEDTKEQLCRLFEGPSIENVVFTENADRSFLEMLRVLFKDGDHLLVSSLESDGVMAALEAVGHDTDSGKSEGLTYTKIPCNEKGQMILYEPGKDDNVYAAVERLLRPNTKGLIINHGSEVCGSILQAKEMSEFAKKHHLLFVLNTSQTAGYVPVYMKQWEIDVLSFCGGYGLLGPEEAHGFVFSDRALDTIGKDGFREKFEPVLPDPAAIAGLHKALDFILTQKIQQLCANGQKMAEYFIRKVQHISGVHIIGPGYKDRVPIVSIQTDFMREAQVADLLKKEWGIEATAGYHGAVNAHKALGTWPRGTLRFAFGYFNTVPQMEKLIQAMYQMTVRSDILPNGSNMPKE